MCHTGGFYGKNPGSQTERGMVTDMKSAERTEHVYREVTLAQIQERNASVVPDIFHPPGYLSFPADILLTDLR